MSTNNITPNPDQAPSQITLPAQDSSNSDGSNLPQAPSPQRGSRLLSTLASIVSTGLSGLPNQGRPSFVTGLGQGARAEKAVQQQQQEIKFRNFDDQVRAAQLHNQDIALQNQTQEQADAHETHMQKMHENDGDWGITYDTIGNSSDAVMDHLRTQTASNGAAVVPPGTHISGDGNSILIPRDTPATNAGQLEQFKAVAPALGMNVNIPQGATKLDPKVATVFYNKLQGFDPNGNPYTADALPALIASNQSRRDELAKQGAPQPQLDALDGIIAKQKAHLKADQDAADTAANKASQRKIAENKAAQENRAAATEDINSKKPTKVDTNMYVGTDKDGNQIAGTSDDLKASGASGVTKLDSDSGKKVIVARQLISPAGLFHQINQDIITLDAKGKTGSAANARFNDALLQKAGSDPDYAPLFVHTHLLSTALMQAHVGSKGSTDMMEEFKSLANSGKMSTATLRSALGAEYNYVHEKAMLPKKQTPTGGQ